MMKIYILAAALAIAASGTTGYTQPRADVRFYCPQNEVINYLQTDYSDNDRVFYHQCRSASIVSTEHHVPANAWGGVMDFHCNPKSVISAITSFYLGGDRIYYFSCSEMKHGTNSCYWTGITGLNSPWTMPRGGNEAIAAIRSQYNASKMDREFYFYVCRY